MFERILIANRGEIACRIIRTAKRLGISTVAVYSEADAGALHTAEADEAFCIGPAPARDSYLSIEKIIAIAQRSGVQAIHPGYGFLSENADFATACAAAGLVFIGPPPSAIRLMGSKSGAKSLMEQSGVPFVPGYHGDAQDPDIFAQVANRVGYPVLVKASAGGGGKGMRVVEGPDDLQSALESARREAESSFGDGKLLIEKYLQNPRHIEIQIFADRHDNFVSLFERDCSIQRRHQKVVEEAPAPGMNEESRAAMSKAAIAAARAVGYVGAGTVEFIAQEHDFWFMEMNTRLQVEHPVTEMITGQDLVEWQLRVACGESLPVRQEDLKIAGHSFEVRICAEDPSRDFLPSVGRILHLCEPDASECVRLDSGVRAGDQISSSYDSMLAKLIVWGETRDAALRRLRSALAHYEIVGVKTNLDLLRAIASHRSFANGDVDTGFISRHANDLLASPPIDAGHARMAVCAVVAALMDDWREDAAGNAYRSEDRWSPWNTPDAWRMNGEGRQTLVLRTGDAELTIGVRYAVETLCVEFPDRTVEVIASREGARMSLRIEDHSVEVSVVRTGDDFAVLAGGRISLVTFIDPSRPPRSVHAGDNRLTAPIPARVTRVLVKPGQSVAKGAPLMVIEAMKMEITLAAPFDGVVSAVRARLDEMVREGAELVTFEPRGVD